MEIELTHEQQQLEREVFNYLKEKIPPELKEEQATHLEGDGPVCRQFLRQLGLDGWMGIGWPEEYGGQGRTPIEQYIFLDLAMGYFNIPIPLLSLGSVGPTLMRVGSEEQKKKYLPRILTTDIIFSVAYTEPEAGTDLFSLTTTAVKDGDDYIINGQKIFTTQGHLSDYFWLAARTDPDTEKQHEGISIFLVDAKSPGIDIRPIYVMGGMRVNQEFFDNVRVPKENLVGEENKGMQYIIKQLAHERIAMVPHSMSLRIIEDITKWANTTWRNGSAIINEPWVQNKLAELSVEVEVLKLLNYRLAWLMEQDVQTHVESAMIKVFGSEHLNRVAKVCQEIMGAFGQLKTGSKWAPANGWIERVSQLYLSTTFGGGTNEVLRDIIGTFGIGLTKSR